MNEYEEQLEQKKSKVLVENNAQAIFDHLTELSNLGGVHERRWLWELLQNAKDSIQESQTVSVEVQLEDNQLIFSHNGTPFTEDEIIHLIYHGSTKKGSLDKTGKFGTGFLTTHLLSRKVAVSGILTSAKPFNFLLDRSGKDPKEVEYAMESSWEQFKKSEGSTSDNGLTTTYRYTLDEQTRPIAEKGLNDLPRLLPFVLAFNSKLENFTLRSSDRYTTFRRSSIENFDQKHIDIVLIETSDQDQGSSRHALAISKENRTAVGIPLNITDESTEIDQVDVDVPKLFFDFPLFGTEDFSFPAIVNSSVQGNYDAIACVHGYIDYLRKLVAGSGELSLTDERTRLTKYQADLAERDVRKSDGELLDTKRAMKVWADATMIVKQRLLGLSSRLAPVVATSQSLPEIKERIDSAIYEVLNELSNPDLGRIARTDGSKRSHEAVQTASKIDRKPVGRRKPKAKSGK